MTNAHERRARPPIRRRPRSSERGAALFIVVLVMVLLSAIGIFAVRVSTLVQVASGYSRRQTSAAYVGELATDVLLADQSDDVATYHISMLSPNNDCRETSAAKSLVSSSTVVPCVSRENGAFLAVLSRNNSALGASPIGEVSRPDLAAVGQAVLPDVRAEITETHLAPGGMSGMAVAGSAVPTTLFEASYTVTSHLHPDMPGGVCGVDSVRSSATSKIRAFVIYPVIGPPPSSGGL